MPPAFICCRGDNWDYINYPQIRSWDLNSTISNFKASGVWPLVLKVVLGWDTTIIWEPVRNAYFWAPPKSTESGILGVRPSILCLSKPYRQFWCSKFQVSIRESVCLFSLKRMYVLGDIGGSKAERLSVSGIWDTVTPRLEGRQGWKELDTKSPGVKARPHRLRGSSSDKPQWEQRWLPQGLEVIQVADTRQMLFKLRVKQGQS